MYRGGGSYHLEIVEAVAGPDGDLAGHVALVQLEIHVQHNKLKPPIQQQIKSEEKKDQTPFRQNVTEAAKPHKKVVNKKKFAVALLVIAVFLVLIGILAVKGVQNYQEEHLQPELQLKGEKE